MFRLNRSLIAGIIALAFLASPVLAQETGSISGTATDPDGAPLPGVAVTLTSSLVPSSTVYTQANGGFRFPVLPAATDYVITFELSGFKTVVNEMVPVRVGGNSQLNVAMELSSVEETVTVTGATPIVDVKSTSVTNNLTEEYMQGIPSARDPWVMLEHTGNVQMDRQNVGGSEGGQQSTFTANGASFSDNVWTYDGAEVTDVRANGASPMYYDFDAFEEISITTGGNDPSVATGGIKINFVTKRGGNDWRGSGRFYLTDGGLQATTVADRDGNYCCSNDPDDYLPGYIGNAIDSIQDYGLEVGGPLVRDKFFAWGSYGKQDIKQFAGASPDNTQVKNYHAKGNAHLGDNLVLQYTFLQANKTKQGRGASATRPPATTWNQGGPSPVHTGKVQYTINDNNYAELSINNTGLGFFLEPQGGRDVQVGYDYADGGWSDSYFYYLTDRPLWNVRADANTYIAGTNVDHELKYGYSYRDAGVYSDSGIGSGIIAAFSGGAPVEAWLVGGAKINTKGQRHSLYAGDTITAGRLVANIGLRYDSQRSWNTGGTTPGVPVLPTLFPPLNSAESDKYGWNTLSPRVGITYDLSGDGRTIARASFSRYGSQMNAGQFDSIDPVGVYREVDTDWFDLNGNNQVDDGEVGDVLWASGGWDPDDPTAPSQNVIGNHSSPMNNEFILGLEREINRNFGVGLNFIYRKSTNFNWTHRIGEDALNWIPINDTIAGNNVTYYYPESSRNSFTTYNNRPDYNTSYMGGDIFLTKRFADRWMANASLALAFPKQNFPTAASYLDPTNIDRLDGNPLAAFGRNGSSGGAAVWSFKASGMYQLGSGFSLAGFMLMRQGYINSQDVLTANRPNGVGRATAIVDQSFGDTKLPTYLNFDFRVEKTFDVGQRGRIHLIADAFNIFNKGNILGRINQQNSSLYPRIREVTQGRTIRLGVRLVLR